MTAGRLRSRGAGEPLEPYASLVGHWLSRLDEHDRVALVQLAHRAFHGVVAERRPVQEPSCSAEAGHPRALGVAVVGEDHDAVGARERALALFVGIAGEAAGGPVARGGHSAVRANRRIGPDRSGEPADRFAADVVRCAARQQPDVAIRYADAAQPVDRAPGRDLRRICPVQRGHRAHLRVGGVYCANRALGRLQAACNAVTAVAAHPWRRQA
jgi:hypothetical protein